MPQIIEGRLGLVLLGGLLLALIAIAGFAWIRIEQLNEGVGQFNETAAAYRQILLYALLAAGLVTILLLWVSAQRTVVPLRRLAAMLADGQSPDPERFASAGADVRNVVLLLGRRAQQERGISSAAATQQTRLATILNNLSVGVVLLTEDERILLANSATAQLFDTMPPTDGTATLMGLARDYEAAEIMRRALREGGTAAGDITLGGNRTRTIRIVASPYWEAGERRVLLVAHDISEEHRAQRLRHEFLANASHEIRTPLAGIQATLEALDMGAIDNPDTARPFVSSALGEVQRLTTFVESLLDLSRLEMGWSRLALQPITVEEAIDRCVGVMSSMAARAEIELVADVRHGVPEIQADPGRLHQALVNLVHNAIKFTQPGGRVTVAADSANSSVWIHVKDTGIGIPSADVETLFDRIGQGDESGMSGGGLGLAIVKQIVEAHQGEAQIESNPGKGSTFSLRFPVSIENSSSL